MGLDKWPKDDRDCIDSSDQSHGESLEDFKSVG
jgi:hypothetical protein